MSTKNEEQGRFSMTGNAIPEMVEVGLENIDKTGFFCYMSKKKTEGYQQNLAWLKNHFAEGMNIKMLTLPERGFIEYIPGQYAKRGVQVDDYMFIHCLHCGSANPCFPPFPLPNG